ncbi:MAG: AAC(3) family N-acetyltransferase, partial [Candidatus Sifarchaeia archaeon]
MKEMSQKRKRVSKQKLINDLTKIGVCKGDHLAVTLSFKSIGYVQGGPNTFIDALLEVVGLKGTILMNTFTYSRSIFSLKPDFVFDPKSTVPYTGLVPSTLVKREDMIRSRHPTRSITAIGYLADYLTKDHDEKSNPYLPYEKLAKVNGKYLCIGIGNRLVAIRHEAQRRAGLFKVPVFLGVYFKNLAGNKELHIAKIAPCKVNLHNIVPKVEEKIKLTRSKIGFANSILANT